MGQLQDCRWYKEGAAARAEGKTVEACEYGGGSPKHILWAEGWKMADIHAPTPAVIVAPLPLPVPRAFEGDLPDITVES